MNGYIGGLLEGVLSSGGQEFCAFAGSGASKNARKTLGFETPAERFNACVASIG